MADVEYIRTPDERFADVLDATAVSWAGWVYLVVVGSLIAFCSA